MNLLVALSAQHIPPRKKRLPPSHRQGRRALNVCSGHFQDVVTRGFAVFRVTPADNLTTDPSCPFSAGCNRRLTVKHSSPILNMAIKTFTPAWDRPLSIPFYEVIYPF